MKVRSLCIAALYCAAAGLLAGRSSHAQTSATLYGLIGLDVAGTKRSGGPPAAIAMQSPGLTAPYWGLRVAEDLGGGYRALAVLESFFQPVNGGIGRTSADPYWGRNAYAGIEGPFGTVTLGRQTNLLYLAEQAVNPFRASILFSPLVMQTFVASYGGAIAGDTVWNNAIQYTSPTVGGLSASAVYAPGGLAGANGAANAGLSLRYASGPLTAVAAAQRTRIVAGAAAPTQHAYLAGFAYAFPRITLYGAIQGTRTTATDTGSHTFEAGVSVPVTSRLSALGEWAYTRRTALRTAVSRNTGVAGLDYTLSRRTDVYALAGYDRLGGSGVAATWALGIRHLF
ncbi:porin [Burkholderia lata]|uniref:porin n=2 Tax=Burkholderia TaxID=32008 RepID=UPI001453FF6B|nr:porin [Burkholderia lata]VWB25622.1 porin [Burkholderia lata]